MLKNAFDLILYLRVWGCSQMKKLASVIPLGLKCETRNTYFSYNGFYIESPSGITQYKLYVLSIKINQSLDSTWRTLIQHLRSLMTEDAEKFTVSLRSLVKSSMESLTMEGRELYFELRLDLNTNENTHWDITNLKGWRAQIEPLWEYINVNFVIVLTSLHEMGVNYRCSNVRIVIFIQWIKI